MEESERQYYTWENTDIQELTDHLKQFCDRANNDLAGLMEELCQCHGDVEAAYNTAEAIMELDIGPGGWFSNIISVNESSMSKYQPVTQEDKEKYEFWKELKVLNEMCKNTYMAFPKLDKGLFESCYALIKAPENMKNYNLDSGLYSQINGYIQAITDMVNKDPKSISLPDYDRFLSEHKAEIEADMKSPKKDGIMEDVGASLKMNYVKFIESSEFGRQLTVDQSLNRTRLPSNFDKMLNVVDIYTHSVAFAASHDMGKLKEISQVFCDSGINLNSKMMEMLKNPISRRTAETISRISGLFFRYTSLGYETYEKFKDSSDAPYCFMKKAPALSNASGIGLSDLSTLRSNDPWKTGGTNYQQIFVVMLAAFRQYFYEALVPARHPLKKVLL